MTIKDIAKLAGVSVSTVSKIINNKDAYINESTRQRVLSIVKEYHYKPYAGVKSEANTFTFGIVIPRDPDIVTEAEIMTMIAGITREAQEQGYAVILLRSDTGEGSERKCISQLVSKNVSGILWYPIPSNAKKAETPSPVSESERDIVIQELGRSSIPYLVISDPSLPDSVCPAYEELGYFATEKLLSRYHTDILCAVHDDSLRSQKIAEGFRRAMVDHNLLVPVQNICRASALAETPADYSGSFSAILCTDQSDALALFGHLTSYHYSVPDNFSIVTALDYPQAAVPYPELSGISLNSSAFGRVLAQTLITMNETGSQTFKKETFDLPLTFIEGRTLDVPYSRRSKSILCIGTINYDCTIISDRLPQSGTSLMAFSSTYSIGGKGVNQAVGVARLGHKVILIGKTGNDPDSARIMKELNINGVLTHAVSHEIGHETGKAYIQLEANGDSTITVVPGANQYLTSEYVRSQEAVFSDASYCMITGEMPLETIIEACLMCSKHQVKTVFKPAAINALPDMLYPLIDYLIPNSYEASTLSGIKHQPSLQADYFLNKGVNCVIITLGASGCYMKNASQEGSYPACHMFSVVDNTGAGDAFVSAFTSCLYTNKSLEDSIRIAQIAAAFNVSKVGSAPSMIDRKTLDNFIRQNSW